ncbi:unnamed protein product, partial [Symbiodinium pilosum]
GVGVAIQALAQSPKAVEFRIFPATGKQLDAAGLQPAGEAPIESTKRVGIRLEVGKAAENAGELPAPVKVFQVSQSSNSAFIPLAKAIATELRWMPAGGVLAVESLLVGKSKNIWTRMYNMAQAVANVSDWQANPARPGVVRPFRCVAQERSVDMQLDDGPEGQPNVEPKALRLVLLADGHPPPRPDGSPG